MKFRKRKEKEVKQVELYLKEFGGGGVLLQAKEGDTTWSIMLFKDGKFSRYAGINKDSLIDVDGRGRIKEAE